jgi:hypothetical protein
MIKKNIIMFKTPCCQTDRIIRFESGNLNMIWISDVDIRILSERNFRSNTQYGRLPMSSMDRVLS